MRLATQLTDGGPRLVVATAEGVIDVAAAAADLAALHDVGALLRAGGDALATAGRLTWSPEVDAGDVTFGPPVLAPGKIICVGLNYRRHAAEGGVAVPAQPILFSKYPNALVGCGAPIRDSALTSELDYEGELAVVIGRRARAVPPERALEFVAGYTIANDISARDLQHGLDGGQWMFGKTLDTFCPIGPYVVTPDDVGSWRDLRLRAWVNGELRQDEECSDMVFGVEELIGYVSRGITLEPGDILLTGTPAGVGLGFDPPRWLRPGDVVDVEIGGLGRLSNAVVAAA